MMNTALLLDLYELTMAQSYFTYRRSTRATFDLFVRQLPANRKYLVSCGLEDVLNYIKSLRFSRQDLEYLKRQRLFSGEFLKFLSGLRFTGDAYAMPEGEIFFADEPLMRVTAPVIEAQILESLLLNAVNLQSMIASKASRVVTAAKDRRVYDFSLRRTHGAEAGLKVARAAYLAGCSGTSNVLAGALYGIPVAGTMAHSFVMSFKHEIDSFLAYAETFPQKSILLVDTYDTVKGIKNAITVALYLKEKGFRLQGIRLDSGDIVGLSKRARRMLDAAGLDYVRIFASGNLDEGKIRDCLKKGALIDSFGVGTNMGTSSDAPSLDVIYKLSEVTDEEGEFLPVMKLSKGKVTYPGRKQVFRVSDKKGKYLKDIIGLEKEKIEGRPLLVKVIAAGKVIYRKPPLDKSRDFLRQNLNRFPQGMKEISSGYGYPVTVSAGLKRLRKRLSGELSKRQ